MAGFNRGRDPRWEIKKYHTRVGRDIIDTNFAKNKMAYFADTFQTYQMLRSHKGIEMEMRRSAQRVARTIANLMPLGKYDRDGHLKFQMKVQRTRGWDGRIAYYVYSDDGRKTLGDSYYNADYQRINPKGKAVKKPSWTKQAIQIVSKGD